VNAIRLPLGQAQLDYTRWDATKVVEDAKKNLSQIISMYGVLSIIISGGGNEAASSPIDSTSEYDDDDR